MVIVFDQLTTSIESFSQHVPLELYATLGGLIEEVVAPIPSPLIMTSAGSLALEQGRTLTYLLFLCLLAAVGKTIGALIIYYAADKSEDFFLTRFGRFLGVSHREVESIGKRLDNTWKDDLLLIFLRAVPVFPGVPVAVVAGLVKINIITYTRSTFIGVFIRSFIFAAIGYYGMAQFNDILSSTESVVQVLLVLATLAAVGYFVYIKRDKLTASLLKIFKQKA